MYMVGQTVHHLKFNYRGVVIGWDNVFRGSDEWYESVARSRPPKDQPWYHVLVHATSQQTYVAERHLEEDTSGDPIAHPMLSELFDDFQNGVYR